MRKAKYLVPIILVAFLLAGCASDMPWRKATVTTFELSGIGIAHIKETAEHLRDVGAIDDAKVAEIKAIYNEAERAHEAAGDALDAAIDTKDAIERDILLEKFDELLTKFKNLAYKVVGLINDIRK